MMLTSAPPAPSTDDCSSSTSPTNTSASETNSIDMLTTLLNSNATGLPPSTNVAKQSSPKTHQIPTIFSPEAVTLLQFSQIFQAQQAVAQVLQLRIFLKRLQAAAHQRQQIQQQQQQPAASSTTQERKRSYPCTFQYCVICQKDVHSSKLPCHIRQCHVAKPMFQCPACDFTSTYSKNNVKSHMVSLHGLAGDPISYMDKYAGQVEEYMKLCFPNVRGRGRPMQGRSSPKSPVSPNRRLLPGRKATMTRSDILSIPTAFNPLRNLRFNPIPSIFPHHNNNNNDLMVPKSSIKQDGQTEQSSSARIQAFKPDESIPPKYIDVDFNWFLLNVVQTKKTVFDSTLNIERITRKISGHLSPKLLIDEKFREKIETVRRRVNLQLFEIMFAIHRMDHKVLDIPLIDLLLEITPTTVDSQILKNLKSVTDPNEEFLLALTKIENLEEKLRAVRIINTFSMDIDAIEKRIQIFTNVSQSIIDSSTLQEVLQMIRAILNISLFNDPTCSTVGGFSLNQIQTILNTTTIEQKSVKTQLLECIHEDVINFRDLDQIMKIIEPVQQDGVFQLLEDLCIIEERLLRAEQEVERNGLKNQHKEFFETSNGKLDSVKQTFSSMKKKLIQLTAYFGNPLPRSFEIVDPNETFNSLQFLVATLIGCYFYFGIQQERIVQGKYDGGEKFTFTQALVFFLCTANTIFAYIFRRKKDIDNVPIRMYAASAASYLLAMICSNQALQYLSYPTQVLAKSCKPIPVMVFGVLFAHKSYNIRKYLYVILIVVGVAMFLYKDKKSTVENQYGTGEVLLIISLAMDGTTTSIQDRINKSYQKTSLSMMFYINLYSSLYLSAGLVVTGELYSFFNFLQRHSYVFWDLVFLAAASCGGQYFIFKTISEFSPLTCSIITTTRKLFTIIISVIFMNHPLTTRQTIATGIVFSGLTMDAIDGKISAKKPTQAEVKVQ
ncbi:unnamed protein product [Caenorhabditis bovis]|uniref:FH2 domain-containing protein n=1 Tax=Caenorhabditis bovis TaxID=2654633 RepID=A0A8S1EG89_9PELO|nr:unnamed protein product [Caenorhabditis bovis]